MLVGSAGKVADQEHSRLPVTRVLPAPRFTALNRYTVSFEQDMPLCFFESECHASFQYIGEIMERNSVRLCAAGAVKRYGPGSKRFPIPSPSNQLELGIRPMSLPFVMHVLGHQTAIFMFHRTEELPESNA